MKSVFQYNLQVYQSLRNPLSYKWLQKNENVKKARQDSQFEENWNRISGIIHEQMKVTGLAVCGPLGSSAAVRDPQTSQPPKNNEYPLLLIV